MKKFFSTGFATIASLLLIFAIVFTSMEYVINDETFINNEFTKLGVNTSMGMSNHDLVLSTVRLIDYMQGDVDDINIKVTVNGEETQMFALEQEVEHMKDVRSLYLQIKGYRDTGVLVMLVLFLFAAIINFRRAPQMLAQGYLSGSFIALLFFGFLGTWALMDFTSFWTFFHQMLFWNDLWLFDATESRMINMLPEQMFSDIVGQIFLYAGIAMAALVAISVFCLVLSSDAHKKRSLEARKRKKARLEAAAARKLAREKAKAEAEKAKRIAAKKAQKAAAAAERKKREAAAAKAREKAARKAARKGSRTQGPDVFDEGYDDDPTNEEYDSDVSVSLEEGISPDITEGYASDFFQSTTCAEYSAGSPDTTTATTTGGGMYPEVRDAEFFKNYANTQSSRTVSEMQLVDGGFSVQHGEEPIPDDFRETYAPASGEPVRQTGRSARAPGNTGRQTPSRKAPGKKPGSKSAAGKPKAKKRSNIEDDTGFFDD